eukprot:Nitzschia sp. Nitz4//scaffold56_size114212//108356//108512//NITZ4_003973-RA/size114212-exonerate_est2genome-gene-0.29-mRNA-1//-1//CDS//3329554775//8243//frame0
MLNPHFLLFWGGLCKKEYLKEECEDDDHHSCTKRITSAEGE